MKISQNRLDKWDLIPYTCDTIPKGKEATSMYPIIDTAELVDLQNVANKLVNLPEKVLLYIAGYTEGAHDATRNHSASQLRAEAKDSA